MHWVTYEKIAESTEQWRLDESHYRLLEKMRWVVTEKIHGAHFCIVTDGSTISGASRKHLLGQRENFFDYQRVLKRLEPQIFLAFRNTHRFYPQLTSLSIYGELFGGAYPHPEVPPISGLQPIQTGIYYTPDIEFCAFDLVISDSQRSSYLDYDQMRMFLQSADIPYVSPLLIGSYQEVLHYPIEFSSTIPAFFGLPSLPQENKAEGVVIKPLKELILSTSKGPLRPIFKRKIAAFAEDGRFHQAQKWTLPLSTSIGHDKLDQLKWEASYQVTENRLLSALSKTGYRGPHEPSRSRRLFSIFVADVLDQTALNQPDLLVDLTKTEQQELLESIKKEVRELLKQFFQKETRRV